MRSYFLRVSLFLSIAAFPVAAQTPQTSPAPPERLVRLLSTVPDDTALVVVIPKWSRLAAGAQSFGQAANLERLARIVPTTALDEMFGTSARMIDANGPIVLAMPATFDEPIIIGLARDEETRSPTTQAVALDDAVLYEAAADQHLVAIRGPVAILARGKADLRRSLRARGDFARGRLRKIDEWLSKSDVVVYADAAALLGETRSRLELVIQAMRMGMAAAGPDSEMALRVWELIFAGARSLTEESRALWFAARIDGRSLACRARLELAADGKIAKYLGEMRPVKRDLLRGLPAAGDPLIVAFEWEDDPRGAGLFEPFYRALIDTPELRQRIGAERVEEVFRENVALGRRMPGSNLVYAFAPDGRGLVYYGNYFADDPPAVAARMREIWDKYPEAMNAWGSFPLNVGPRVMERIDGHEVEVRSFELNVEAQGRMAAVQPIMQAVYGNDPALFMTTTTNGIAFAFGERAAARTVVEKVVGSNSPALKMDPAMRSILKELSPSPQVLVLVDLPGLVRGLGGLIQRMGFRLAPGDLSGRESGLAGAAAYVEPQAIVMETYIPAASVRDMMTVVQRLSEPNEELPGGK